MGNKIKKVLSVDDSRDVGRLIQTLLQEEAVECLTASNGKEAMDILNKEAVDVVLLDIKMPGEDGVSVLKNIRKKGLDTKVIMLTSCNDKNTVLDCYFEKADDFLLKPVVKTQLLAKLHKLEVGV